MPKNTDFNNILLDPNLFKNADATKAKAALDAIITADIRSDGRAFGAAIQANAAFWGGLPGVPADLMTVPAGDVRDDYFGSERFLVFGTMATDPSIGTLQDHAIRQRMILGLRDVTSDVLVHILANNEAECQAYLRDRNAPTLGVSSEPQRNRLINDTGFITYLRREAMNEMMRLAVASAGDNIEHLDRLLRAINPYDQGTLTTILESEPFRFTFTPVAPTTAPAPAPAATTTVPVPPAALATLVEPTDDFATVIRTKMGALLAVAAIDQAKGGVDATELVSLLTAAETGNLDAFSTAACGILGIGPALGVVVPTTTDLNDLEQQLKEAIFNKVVNQTDPSLAELRALHAACSVATGPYILRLSGRDITFNDDFPHRQLANIQSKITEKEITEAITNASAATPLATVNNYIALITAPDAVALQTLLAAPPFSVIGATCTYPLETAQLAAIHEAALVLDPNAYQTALQNALVTPAFLDGLSVEQLIQLDSLTDAGVLFNIIKSHLPGYPDTGRFSGLPSSTIQGLVNAAVVRRGAADQEKFNQAITTKLIEQALTSTTASAADLAALATAKNPAELLQVLQGAPFSMLAGVTVAPTNWKVPLEDSIVGLIHAKVVERGIAIADYVEQLIERSPEKLGDYSVIAHDNLVGFKAKFGKEMGLSPDIMTALDTANAWSGIQSKVWKTRLELILDARTSLGSAAYTVLIGAFENLTPEQKVGIQLKQVELAELLVSGNNKAAFVALGFSDADAQNIVDENTRLNKIKEIHNSGIAAVLANMSPAITLNDAEILAINAQIRVCPNPCADNDYVNLVTNLSNLSPLTSRADETKRAFGLAAPTGAGGLWTISNHAIKAGIVEQHTCNKPIFDRYPGSTAIPTVFNFLLSQKKDSGNLLDTTKLDAIELAYDQGEDYRKFMGTPELIGAGYKPNNEINSIKIELTEERYNALKFQGVSDQLADNTVETSRMILPPILKGHKAIKESQEAIKKVAKRTHMVTEAAEKLMYLKDIEPIHLASPAFLTQGKKKHNTAHVKAHYTELGKQITAAVESLRQDHAELEARKKVVGDAMVKPGINPDLLNDLQAHSDEIDAQMKEIKAAHDACLVIDAKLNDPTAGAIALLDKEREISLTKKGSNFTSEVRKGITTYTPGASPIASTPATASSGGVVAGTVRAAGSASSTQTLTDPLNEFLVDRLNPGSIRVTEMTGTIPATTAGAASTTGVIGVFTEEKKNTTVLSTSGVIKKSTVSQPATEGKVRIEVFPENGTDAEKVAFAMAAATALIAMGSKGCVIDLSGAGVAQMEQYKYVWTALMILGKENPSWQFGPKDVKVPPFMERFVAEQQEVSLKNYFKSGMEFSDRSFYKTNFVGNTACQAKVNEVTDQLKVVAKSASHSLELQETIAKQTNKAVDARGKMRELKAHEAVVDQKKAIKPGPSI